MDTRARKVRVWVENNLAITDDRKTLLISELYDQLTVQGEGPHIGVPCTFMRLGGCNLKCGINGGWKCDSPYTWDWAGDIGPKYDPRTDVKRMALSEIRDWLKNINDTSLVRTLVVTGGEPLLQDANLGAFFGSLCRDDNEWKWFDKWDIHIETNGTIQPDKVVGFVDHYSVSPKLANSGNPLEKRLDIEVLQWFAKTQRACFKFVASKPSDFTEIDELVAASGMPPARVYIMPEGVTTGAIGANTQAVVQSVIERGYRLTTRLHIYIFGNKRGT